MKMTLQKRWERFFKNYGQPVEITEKGKYIKIKFLNNSVPDRAIWLGKNGAIRYGRIISDSISVTHKYPVEKLALWEKSKGF